MQCSPNSWTRLAKCSAVGERGLKRKLLSDNKIREEKTIIFGTTIRWAFSAFQTLSFSNRFTLTFKPSEFTFTLTTKNCAVHHLYHCQPKHAINDTASGIVLYFIRDLEVRKRTAPTEKFFYFKKIFTLLKAVASKILDDDFEQSWSRSRNRDTLHHCPIIISHYTKIKKSLQFRRIKGIKKISVI